MPTVKPLDEQTILASVRKTGIAVSAEEAQAAAGFGGAVAELLGEKLPAPLLRVGMPDRFGESGEPDELIRHFALDAGSIAARARHFMATHGRVRP